VLASPAMGRLHPLVAIDKLPEVLLADLFSAAWPLNIFPNGTQERQGGSLPCRSWGFADQEHCSECYKSNKQRPPTRRGPRPDSHPDRTM
jgi:hypothetical protein